MSANTSVQVVHVILSDFVTKTYPLNVDHAVYVLMRLWFCVNPGNILQEQWIEQISDSTPTQGERERQHVDEMWHHYPFYKTINLMSKPQSYAYFD